MDPIVRLITEKKIASLLRKEGTTYTELHARRTNFKSLKENVDRHSARSVYTSRRETRDPQLLDFTNRPCFETGIFRSTRRKTTKGTCKGGTARLKFWFREQNVACQQRTFTVHCMQAGALARQSCQQSMCGAVPRPIGPCSTGMPMMSHGDAATASGRRGSGRLV